MKLSNILVFIGLPLNDSSEYSIDFTNMKLKWNSFLQFLDSEFRERVHETDIMERENTIQEQHETISRLHKSNATRPLS